MSGGVVNDHRSFSGAPILVREGEVRPAAGAAVSGEIEARRENTPAAVHVHSERLEKPRTKMDAFGRVPPGKP